MPFIFLILAGMCLARPLFAETTNIGDIYVYGDAESESPQAPSSFTTVIRPETVHAEFRDLGDLISQTVGVNLRDTGGLGQFSSISIRGSTSDQVAVFLDGVRLNSDSSGTVDLSTIPVDIIDRIEVIRGGGSAQFGQDAIGGVINIITKHGRQGTQTSVTVGGGSFETLKAGAMAAHQDAKRSGLISVNHFMTKGDYSFKAADTTLSGGTIPSAGQTFSRIHNRSLSESVLAKGDLHLNDQWFLQAMDDFYFTSRQLPGTEEETTLLYPTNPLDAQEKFYRNISALKANCIDCGTEHLLLQPGFDTQYEHRHFSDDTPAVGSPINFVTQYWALNPNMTAQYQWHGAGEHAFQLRGDYRYERQTDSPKNSTTVPIGTQVRNIGSIVGQDEWQLLDNRLKLIPVLRFVSGTGFRSNVSAKLGISASPQRWVTLKANAENSFRLPTFNELYFPDEGFLRGNPNLAKETAINWDAGVIFTPSTARIELVFYQNLINNSIIFVPISATTIQPINTFEARVYGIEATARVHPWKTILIEGNYTWTRARFVSSDNQLPGRPEHHANVHIGYDKIWNDRWKGSLYTNFQYVSSQPVNQQNTVFIAAYSQVDAGVSATMWKQWTLIVEGKDLTNAQIYDVQGFPLPRRSVFGTVKWAWDKG